MRKIYRTQETRTANQLEGKRRATWLTRLQERRGLISQIVWPPATRFWLMLQPSERHSLLYFLPFQATRYFLQILGWQYSNKPTLQFCNLLPGLEEFEAPLFPEFLPLFTSSWEVNRETGNAYYTVGTVRYIFSSNPHGNLVKCCYLHFSNKEPQSHRH